MGACGGKILTLAINSLEDGPSVIVKEEGIGSVLAVSYSNPVLPLKPTSSKKTPRKLSQQY